MKIDIDYSPSDEDKGFLIDGLISSNLSNGMPNKQDCWVFAYDEKGEKVGGCKSFLFSKVVWIDMLWVDKLYQGKGYGKKLLEATENEAKQKGCTVAALDTFEFQQAFPFYKKCGYKIVSRVEALNGNDERYFYEKNFINGIIYIMASLSPSENENQNKEIVTWGYDTLLSLGYTVKARSPEIVLRTHWSFVARYETTDGYIYLKHTPEQIALEASIIKCLHDQFHAGVPIIIGHREELCAFLMKDAGSSLRGILNKQFDTELLCKAIEQFTSIQVTVADQINVFLDMDVPDWRLDKLPAFFEQCLSETDLLQADGLSDFEVNKIKSLVPTVARLCSKLSSYGIKQTIVQPDCNPNNMLVTADSQKITIIDFGEISISHPFFSLLNCMFVLKKRHGLLEEDERYQEIKDACLNNFLNTVSKKQLEEAWGIAQTLWFVYDVLAQFRFIHACGKENIMSFQPGKLSNTLRDFIVGAAAFEMR